MKKTFAILLCAVLILSVVIAVSACNPSDVVTDTLVVYNWADYIYDTRLVDFKAYYKDLTGNNIDITYVTFDTNETMLTKLMQGDAKVDVICPSEYAIQKLLENDMLVPLNYFDEQAYVAGMNVNSALYEHNADNIDGHIIAKIDEGFSSVNVKDNPVPQKMSDYLVPYMYGTLGILYNKYAFADMGIYDYDTMNRANWGILFNDDGQGNKLHESLTGNILMKDSIRDSYAATVFYLKESGRLDGLKTSDGGLYTDMPAGELINAVDDTLIELCKNVLTEQKSELFGYEVDFGKDDLLKGNAMVDLAWSGDAMYAVEESWNDYLCPVCMTNSGVEQGSGDDAKIVCSNSKCDSFGEECGDYELGYYVPHTAGNIWFDGWVIPKTHNPSHLNAIKLFINFLNNPDVAAANMMEIGYSSAVSPEAVRNDEGARSILCEAYVVNDDSWAKVDEKGNKITQFDYDSWEEFAEYYFDYRDEMDDSNWRYPFLVAEDDGLEYNRSLDTLGVMRDYGENNKAVVTMWNYARSAGVTALPLLGWTALAVAVAVGVIVLCEYIKRHRNSVVKLTKQNEPNDEPLNN